MPRYGATSCPIFAQGDAVAEGAVVGAELGKGELVAGYGHAPCPAVDG